MKYVASVALVLAHEERQQAPTGNITWNIQICSLIERRRHIDEAYEIVHHRSLSHLGRPTNCKRHSGPTVIVVALAARERHAVIACHNDDGVVEFTALLKHLNRVPNQAVETLHLKIIIRNVASDFIGIREMCE